MFRLLALLNIVLICWLGTTDLQQLLGLSYITFAFLFIGAIVEIEEFLLESKED